jgi:hypothetical protein
MTQRIKCSHRRILLIILQETPPGSQGSRVVLKRHTIRFHAVSILSLERIIGGISKVINVGGSSERS